MYAKNRRQAIETLANITDIIKLASKADRPNWSDDEHELVIVKMLLRLAERKLTNVVADNFDLVDVEEDDVAELFGKLYEIADEVDDQVAC